MSTHIYFKKFIKDSILTDIVIDNAILAFKQFLESHGDEESKFIKEHVLPFIEKKELVNGQPYIFYIWDYCFQDKNYELLEIEMLPQTFIESTNKRLIHKAMSASGKLWNAVSMDEISYEICGKKYVIFENIMHGNEMGQIPIYKTRNDAGYVIDSSSELSFYLEYCKKLDKIQENEFEYAVEIFKKFNESKLTKEEIEYNKAWISQRLTNAFNQIKANLKIELDNHPDLADSNIKAKALQQLENDFVLSNFAAMTDIKIEAFKTMYATDDFLVEIL